MNNKDNIPERIWISTKSTMCVWKDKTIPSIHTNDSDYYDIEYIRRDIIDKQRREFISPIVGVLHKLGESPTKQELIEAIHETINLAKDGQ